MAKKELSEKVSSYKEIARHDSYGECIPFTSYAISEFIGSLHVRIYDLGSIAIQPQWWPGNNLHIDPFTRIYYFTEGGASFTCNGVEFAIKPGRFYLFPAQARVSFCCHSAYHYLLHCRLSVWGEVDLWHLVRGSGVEMIDFPPSLAERFMELCDHHPVSPAKEVELIGLTYELLARFWELGQWEIPEYPAENVNRIQRALRMINHCSPKVISVNELAKAAGLSRSSFSVEFKRLIGIAPALYMMERRLEQAQRMLLNSDMTLEAIADELGFSSAFHLSRAFKKRYGIAPREFRTNPRNVLSRL